MWEKIRHLLIGDYDVQSNIIVILLLNEFLMLKHRN